mmetsp:Transcript_22261/g.25052  ORF Transcript_22261/g.25052 Transcript_22261/m.25052 type:complete len:102 (-) Transcript_22261:352-657(-)
MCGRWQGRNTIRGEESRTHFCLFGVVRGRCSPPEPDPEPEQQKGTHEVEIRNQNRNNRVVKSPDDNDHFTIYGRLPIFRIVGKVLYIKSTSRVVRPLVTKK